MFFNLEKSILVIDISGYFFGVANVKFLLNMYGTLIE